MALTLPLVSRDCSADPPAAVLGLSCAAAPCSPVCSPRATVFTASASSLLCTTHLSVSSARRHNAGRSHRRGRRGGAGASTPRHAPASRAKPGASLPRPPRHLEPRRRDDARYGEHVGQCGTVCRARMEQESDITASRQGALSRAPAPPAPVTTAGGVIGSGHQDCTLGRTKSFLQRSGSEPAYHTRRVYLTALGAEPFAMVSKGRERAAAPCYTCTL
jgi:hypothetical protein